MKKKTQIPASESIMLIDGESIVDEPAFAFMCHEMNLNERQHRYARAYIGAYEVARRNVSVKRLH
jgi:hypothetical protein